LPLVIVPRGLGPDLVGDRAGPVGEPGRGLGECQRGALGVVEERVSYQAATVSSFSGLTPALAALAAPASTQALQPLIWLARRCTSSSV
jgi:hypothetical protein